MAFFQSDNVRGYEKINDEFGNSVFVDKQTGELVDATTPEVPAGSIIYTPQQQEEWKNRKEHEAKARLQRSDKDSFYFTINKNRCDLIKPQTLARLFFLATYLQPRKQVLYLRERTKMGKADMQELLRLRKVAFYDFWNEANGLYISENQDGEIIMGNDFFRDVIRGHCSDENGFQKIFIDSLRELYWQTPVSKHKYLGYLFLVLPNINHEWNVLCKNPLETELDKIEYLSLPEFCSMVHWNPKQVWRVITAYRNLTFEYEGKRQYICAYLWDRVSKGDRLIINPKILYRGSDPEQVMSFGMFFPSESC